MYMKFILTGALLAAIVLTARDARSKTLEEILKEKGVISEADYKEISRNKPLDYKLGKGFTLTSADKKFQLTIGGRMLIRYTFLDREDNSKSSDMSQFDVRKGQIWFQGYAYSRDLGYRLQMCPSEAGSSKVLEYAYISYHFADEFNILGGQTKLPFGRQVFASVKSRPCFRQMLS
jgi:phosphate-selective porin OprO/OprP